MTAISGIYPSDEMAVHAPADPRDDIRPSRTFIAAPAIQVTPDELDELGVSMAAPPPGGVSRKLTAVCVLGCILAAWLATEGTQTVAPIVERQASISAPGP